MKINFNDIKYAKYVVIILLIISACNNKKADNVFFNSNNSKTYKIQLQDIISNISITVPIKFDTSYEWIHSSCGCVHNKKFRVQSKLYQKFLENGFYWKNEPKEKSEMTLEQQYLGEIVNKRTKFEIESEFKTLKEDNKNAPNLKNCIFDTLIHTKIDYFPIFIYSFLDSLTNNKKITCQSNFYLGKTYIRIEQIETKIMTEKEIELIKKEFIETLKSIKQIN